VTATLMPAPRDLGWQKDNSDVHPLYKGLSNEELWLLIRRFDKMVFGLRRIPELPIGGLDVLSAPDEQYSPDKLRAALERLYMTLVRIACSRTCGWADVAVRRRMAPPFSSIWLVYAHGMSATARLAS
jgi:hypothetical protein